MHDTDRRGDVRRTGSEAKPLVADEKLGLSFEHVERVDVIVVGVVEMRIRSRASVREERLGDAELVEVRLDDDPPLEERFALAGPVHDTCHLERV